MFLDVGGFDGDTALMHAIVDPEYEKIVVLEPSALNRSIAVERLNSLARVEVLPFGVGRFNGVLPFCDELGVASCVSKEGDSTIQVRRIDDLGLRKLTFLKMDIEGAELDALVGAERLIVKHKPKIAIAAYHKPDDFREISRIVLHMNPGYKMSLRHYTEGWSESVLYFY